MLFNCIDDMYFLSTLMRHQHDYTIYINKDFGSTNPKVTHEIVHHHCLHVRT